LLGDEKNWWPCNDQVEC